MISKILFLFTFSGRINRAKFALYQIPIILIILPLNKILITPNTYITALGPLIIAILILEISSISFTVRRLHDVNLNAWFILVSLIPVIGSAFGIVLFFKRPYDGINKYGANPVSKINEFDNLVVENN